MAEYIEREALKELVRKHFKIAIDAGMNNLDEGGTRRNNYENPKTRQG